MAEWYEKPYAGGPMPIPAAYFPRPLYPPDAAEKGKAPSKPGPDVEAYKITICRLGRWEPWDPASWDRDFNNKFSHGRGSGNVGDSGIAGFQRQMNIEPTGWVGKETFNKMASSRVPEGRTHAGEMAMTPNAVSLIEEAFDLYGGKAEIPPPPVTANPPRERLAAHFSARDGYTEQPAESNCDNRSDGIRTAQDKTAQGSTWLRYEPWCGCWCYYALASVGVTGMNSWMASVASIEDRAKQKLSPFTGWTTDRSRVKTGDLVVIGGYGVHVGTVRGFSGSNTLTWEGNTSAGTSGSQSNGGGAYHRTRYPSEVRGYALVRYPGE